MNIILRRVLKIGLWLIAVLFIVIVLIALSLNLSSVQNFIKDKAISYLKSKTNTEVSLKRISIVFPNDIVLNEFYLEDLKGDTLVYAERLAVDISLFKLFKSQVEIKNIELNNINANVVRIAPDTTFNFNFLVNAFMSDQQKSQEEIDKDTTSTLKFSIDKFKFENIRIQYRDDVAGNILKLSVGNFNSRIDDFDLNNQKFKIKNINLQNAQLDYLQQKPLAILANQLEKSVDPSETANSVLPFIEIEKLMFDKVKINFNDKISATQAIANIQDLQLSQSKLNLTEMNYVLGGIKLQNSQIKFAFKPEPLKTSVGPTEIKDSPNKIKFTLQKFDLKNNIIQFDNLAERPILHGIDFNHLVLTSLNLSGKDIGYSEHQIQANILNGSFKDKSGFELQLLKGIAKYTNHEISIKDFALKTPYTQINSQALIQYNNIEDLTKKPSDVKLNLSIINTQIGMHDAFFFSDAIPEQYKNLNLKVDGNLNGNLASINIPEFKINGLSNTKIDIQGKADNITNPDALNLDLTINHFITNKQDINLLSPKGSLPKTINLPSNIVLNGKFKGGLKKFDTNLAVKSSLGNAKLQAELNSNEQYNAQIHLENFDVGTLLNQQNELGKISLKAHANGKGFDLKTAKADLKGTIESLNYNKYNYQNIQLTGSLDKQKFQFNTLSNDENVDFSLAANGNLSNTYPKIAAKLELNQIDLQAINFSTSEFKAAGIINANIETADLDYLNGTVKATSLQIVKDGKRINVDTIKIESLSSEDANSLTINSEVLQAKLEGNYKLSQIGQAFINQINKYYQFGEIRPTEDQKINFDVNIYNSKLLKEFVPKLETFAASSISGQLNTLRDSLSLRAWFPKIVYDKNAIDSALLTLRPVGAILDYNLNIKSIVTPSIQLFNSEIKGSASNNMLNVNVFLKDKARKNRYALTGDFNAKNNIYQFSLKPENLLLNYERWTVNPNNLIQFGKDGILANNFNLSKGEQLLRIQSRENTPNAPIEITLKDFKIETLTSFAETDTSILGGTLNGKALLSDIQTNMNFNANLVASQLRYQKDHLGTLRLDANNQTNDAIEINASLTGIHEARVNGFYYTNENGALDLNLNLEKLNLEFIESLSGGQIREGTGTISANLTAKGAISEPIIQGKVNFNKAGFNIKYVNSFFRVPQETISFNNKGINFDSFTLIDSLGKTAIIDGSILTTNYQDFKFNLDLRTNNFRALNSTSKDNELIYGTVYLSSNLKILGDLNQPIVNGNVNVNEDTKFFFAMPADDPAVIEQSGIVQFIDADAPPFNGERALNIDSLTRSPLTGMNLSVNLTIDKKAELNVVIDPSNGDALKVKGEGSLNATIDPSGKTSLTGRYQLTDGSYNLSIGGLARKEFKIQPESYIVWTGEPTSADINITAIYEVNTAAIDLVADQMESLDASARNIYKQKLDFQVLLYLKGELLKPNISFKIDLPEDERASAVGAAAFAKLQQVNSNESELNKQVFALLALNRFISENPFQSLAGGSSTSSIARQSVSKLLTEQLNNLANNLIQGIDINFGVNAVEDYSSGQLANRTDLEIDFSKKLLNDRITISVGSTFGIEGNRPSNQKSSNIAGNINVEYLISADGRYRLRFYRRNETEGIVEGQIIETGVGFALVVDYNRFNEIFKKASRGRNLERKNTNNNK